MRVLSVVASYGCLTYVWAHRYWLLIYWLLLLWCTSDVNLSCQYVAQLVRRVAAIVWDDSALTRAVDQAIAVKFRALAAATRAAAARASRGRQAPTAARTRARACSLVVNAELGYDWTPLDYKVDRKNFEGFNHLARQQHPEFICPVTQEVMSHPIVMSDGYTYDVRAISDWLTGCTLKGKTPTSPMTNLPFARLEGYLNLTLRSQIYSALEAYMRRHTSPLSGLVKRAASFWTDER